jgi:hypothetical protein
MLLTYVLTASKKYDFESKFECLYVIKYSEDHIH